MFVIFLLICKKACFDTVDHNILIGELKHDSIREVAYSWFDSYVKGRKNMFQSMDLTLKIYQFLMEFHKVLFLDHYCFFFNNLHTAIIFCKVHHFADDANLLPISKSIKQLNLNIEFVSFNLNNLSNWLNDNKISLNVSKTELIIFKPRMKKVASI